MDPVTIATAALTILTPYVKDAGRELVKTVGEIALDKAKGLMGWLKERFAGDPVAAKDLSRFEADPNTFEPSLRATISEKAQTDPAFGAELKKRIDDIGPLITVFQRIKEGKNVTAVEAKKIGSGTVTATQEIDKGENIKGVQADEIG